MNGKKAPYINNVIDLGNETNKRLRKIEELICCIEGSYNSVETVSISAAGTSTFNPKTVHSIAWELGSGATLTINNGTNSNTFSSNGGFSFSRLNVQTITLTAVGGTVKVIYTY